MEVKKKAISGSLLHAREVERSWQHRKPKENHLRLAFTCEGGGEVLAASNDKIIHLRLDLACEGGEEIKKRPRICAKVNQ